MYLKICKHDLETINLKNEKMYSIKGIDHIFYFLRHDVTLACTTKSQSNTCYILLDVFNTAPSSRFEDHISFG